MIIDKDYMRMKRHGVCVSKRQYKKEVESGLVLGFCLFLAFLIVIIFGTMAIIYI